LEQKGKKTIENNTNSFRNILKKAENSYQNSKNKKDILIEKEKKPMEIIHPYEILKRKSVILPYKKPMKKTDPLDIGKKKPVNNPNQIKKKEEKFANMMIIYKDKERIWVPKFEVKALPFYWKFLPNFEKNKNNSIISFEY